MVVVLAVGAGVPHPQKPPEICLTKMLFFIYFTKIRRLVTLTS